jgi:ABC-type glycerol-3-phosphate transport system substrate-binding protein
MKRWMLIVALLALSLTLAACGGGAPAATAVPSGDNASSAAGAGSPADAVRGYFQAIYTGEGDIASMFCGAYTEEQRAAATEALQSVTAAFAAAGTDVTIDTSGLTFTTQDETAETASVVAGGSVSVTVAGTTQEVPIAETTIQLRNENGWKVCG